MHAQRQTFALDRLALQQASTTVTGPHSPLGGALPGWREDRSSDVAFKSTTGAMHAGVKAGSRGSPRRYDPDAVGRPGHHGGCSSLRRNDDTNVKQAMSHESVHVDSGDDFVGHFKPGEQHTTPEQWEASLEHARTQHPHRFGRKQHFHPGSGVGLHVHAGHVQVDSRTIRKRFSDIHAQAPPPRHHDTAGKISAWTRGPDKSGRYDCGGVPAPGRLSVSICFRFYLCLLSADGPLDRGCVYR